MSETSSKSFTNGLVSGKAVDVTSENNGHQQSSLF